MTHHTRDLNPPVKVKCKYPIIVIQYLITGIIKGLVVSMFLLTNKT